VPKTVYALLLQAVGPDNEGMMSEISEVRWTLGVFFAVFLFLSAITIMNMLVGILCEAMTTVAQQEQDAADLKRMSALLRQILTRLDKDFDNLVSKQEFTNMMEMDDVIRVLRDAGIDVYALVDDVDFIFDERAGPNNNKLPFSEFLEVMLEFRDTNSAAIRSISALRKSLRQSIDVVSERMKSLERVVVAGNKFKDLAEAKSTIIETVAHQDSDRDQGAPAMVCCASFHNKDKFQI
jgi:hypothetical protein